VSSTRQSDTGTAKTVRQPTISHALAPRTPIRVPVAGQIEAEQRTPERKGNRVVGVGVLGPTVEQNHRWSPHSPAKPREHPTIGKRDGDPLDVWRGVERQAPLGRVLVKEAELVVRKVCHEFRP
jgi:hypothetical protein